MIMAVDVDYRNDSGKAAGVIFESWEDEAVIEELVLNIDRVADYVPGMFYKRELPCIMVLLKNPTCPVTTLIIDGYVYLGSQKIPGLGRYLWEELQGAIPVIGVAKSYFNGTPKHTEIVRGKSKNPLYVTAEGVEEEVAKRYISNMKGQYRIPALLKYVDALCRSYQGKD